MVETQFPVSGLSAEYGDIIISEVVGNVLLTITLSSVVIQTELYTPDSDGNICIQDIGKLAETLISGSSFHLANGVDNNSVIQLNLQFEDSETTLSKTVTIYECIIDFSGSLDITLLKIIPLTRMTKKITGPGRTEFVSFYGAGTVSAYVVKKGTIQDISATYEVMVLDTADVMYRVNVSPSVMATLAGCEVADLVYYNVYTSLDAIIKFTMDQRNYPVKNTFVFRNCFGAQETFTCTGDEESTRKWTREFGVQNNSQLQLSRDMVNAIKVNTGFITSLSVEALEDLLNTDQLAILDDYEFQPIVILEENFSNNSRRDILKSFDFTYRFTRHNQFRTTYASFKKPRIFDATFDQTFD